jgi:protein-(glutamine-N5) methyltransferase, release factor-specific
MVVRELLSMSAKKLKEANIPNPVLDARLIIEHVLGQGELFVVKNPSFVVPEMDITIILENIEKRVSHMPLSYITNSREFMSLPFYVDENVLIPRPDSECLVETVLELLKTRAPQKHAILDIGIGSGALAISVAFYDRCVIADGIDISPEAVSVAKKNAEQNGVLERCEFFVCDILKEELSKKYDVILSNPPYIRPDVIKTLESDVRDYEPMGALNGGEDGLLFYRTIAKKANNMLKGDGVIAFEIGYDQKEEVMDLLYGEGFSEVTCHEDLAGNPRVVIAKRTC